MTQIEKHIDRLFRSIPGSSAARKLKAELLNESREKLEKYKKMKKTDEHATELVISEIGSAEELRESLPATGTLTNIVAAVFFIVFAFCCFIAAYYRITDESYEKMFSSFFEYTKIAFARPMRWGTGGFLILWTLARYSKAGVFIRIRSFPLRVIVLIISAAFFIFYIGAITCIWTGSPACIKSAFLSSFESLWSGGQYFLIIFGALLFLGLRR